MSSMVSLDEVFSCNFANNFGLSEVESINEDDDGIYSYLENSRIDHKAVVAHNLPSGESTST